MKRITITHSLLSLVIPLVAGGVVWWIVNQQEKQVVSAQKTGGQLDAAANLREIGEISAFLEEMKLVTVRTRATVTGEAHHENFRGRVGARVFAPVDFFYGVDLAKLGEGAVQRSLVNPKRLKITVPAPQLQAVEVHSEDEQIDVDTSGLRFRTRAGEYYLGLARRNLHRSARDRALLPAQMDRVKSVSRQQIRRVVEILIEDSNEITVVFTNG